MYKRMADNAEEMASKNLAKLRKAQVKNMKYSIVFIEFILGWGEWKQRQLFRAGNGKKKTENKELHDLLMFFSLSGIII